MNDKGIPIILVSLAILFTPVKSGAEIPASEHSEITQQLKLIRTELSQQGRRIAALEQSADTTAQTPGYNVVAPSRSAEPNIPSAPRSNSASPSTYTVRLGDSLSIIAKRNGVSVESIVEANQLASADKIKIGQRLVIPAKPAPPKTEPEKSPASPAVEPKQAATTLTHELQPGETLFGLARRYKVKVEDIQSYNGIANPTTVWAGQVLRIPGVSTSKPKLAAATQADPKPAAQSSKGDKEGKHTVVRGESLSKIAAAHGVSVADLQAVNGINNPDQIFEGQTLLLPGSGTLAKKVTTKTTATKVAANPAPTKSKPAPPKKQTPSPSTPKTEDLGVDDYMGYFVVRGDTVESIASIFNTSASRLRRINDIPAGGQFRAGDQILVPAESVFSS